MGPNFNEVVNQPATPVTPPPVVNPDNKPKKSHKSLFFLLGMFIVLILVGGIASGYYFGRSSMSNELNQVVPTNQPNKDTDAYNSNLKPKAISDDIEDWKVVKINTVNMEFKIPQKLQKYGNLKEETTPGDTGTQLCLILTKETSALIPNAHAGGGCFSQLSVFNLGTTSTDYTAGRGGAFIDYQGFIKKDEKYYAKFVSSKEVEIDQDIVSEISNNNSVQIIKVKGVSIKGGDADGFPVSGSPGEGWYGALINTVNSFYTGLALQIKTSEISEEEFDQILSTFKFTK